jgi:hypothetical protein
MIRKLLSMWRDRNKHDWVTIERASPFDIYQMAIGIERMRCNISSGIYRRRVCLNTGEVRDEISIAVEKEKARLKKRDERCERAKQIYEEQK